MQNSNTEMIAAEIFFCPAHIRVECMLCPDATLYENLCLLEEYLHPQMHSLFEMDEQTHVYNRFTDREYNIWIQTGKLHLQDGISLLVL